MSFVSRESEFCCGLGLGGLVERCPRGAIGEGVGNGEGAGGVGVWVKGARDGIYHAVGSLADEWVHLADCHFVFVKHLAI